MQSNVVKSNKLVTSLATALDNYLRMLCFRNLSILQTHTSFELLGQITFEVVTFEVLDNAGL